jgi:hypothetical protein
MPADEDPTLAALGRGAILPLALVVAGLPTRDLNAVPPGLLGVSAALKPTHALLTAAGLVLTAGGLCIASVLVPFAT